MRFIIVCGCLIAFGIWLLICSAFYKIAEMKGHLNQSYFWWTFFTGIIGMLMIVALPDRAQNNNSPAQPSLMSSDDELPEI